MDLARLGLFLEQFAELKIRIRKLRRKWQERGRP